jgi:hypothetical protein
VVVSCKDWDLSDEKGQEQWLDIIDGLGALRVGIQVCFVFLFVCLFVSFFTLRKKGDCEFFACDASDCDAEKRSCGAREGSA